MNKKEQAQFEELKTKLALRFTEAVTKDVPIPPHISNELAKGYLFNSYSLRVEPSCSNSIHHNFGGNGRTTTQGGRELYSTRERALRAMRNELEERFANELRRVDIMIEKEINNNLTP
jgi:hypothetical protein